ncbi:MAG: hypothetical protein EGQ09_18130 [Clostridiales bacterium]|nr:hypothetical protein [Clostridiales bacterium]
MQSVTLYYPGTSFFHLCDCRVKLLLMLMFTVVAFLFYNPIVPAALFAAALLMNLSAIGTRTFKNFLFKMIVVMMAFLLVSPELGGDTSCVSPSLAATPWTGFTWDWCSGCVSHPSCSSPCCL